MENVFTAFVVAFGLSLWMVPLISRLALKWGAVDLPGGRKIHAQLTPRMGGVGIFLSTIIGWGILFVLEPSLFRTGVVSKIVCIGFPVAMLIGLWDDLRSIGSRRKFILQLVLGFVVYSLGFRMEVLSLGPGYEFQLGIWSLPVTIFWVAAVMNAINLIDGLDGLAAGVSCITMATIALFAYGFDNFAVVGLACVTMGAMLGFLRFNFSPAKIFMGDSGSMSIGFLLAILTLAMSPRQTGGLPIYIPIFLLAFPILDTTVAILRRIIRSLDTQFHLKVLFQYVFSADGDHIHHRLLSRGFSQRQVALFLYGFSAAGCLLSFLVLILPAPYSWFFSLAALFGIRQMVLALDYVEFYPKSVRRQQETFELAAPIGAPPSVVRQVEAS